MTIRKGTFLVILLLAGLAGGAAGYELISGHIKLPKQPPLPVKQTKSPSPQLTPSPQESLAPASVKTVGPLGTITGSADFPAGNPPADLQVCAQSTTDPKATTCTNGVIHDNSGRYIAGLGFRLDVPPGTYQVYSVSQAFNPKLRGFYSKAVDCARQHNAFEVYGKCPDHGIVTVTVKASERTSSVDAVDFYVPENDFRS